MRNGRNRARRQAYIPSCEGPFAGALLLSRVTICWRFSLVNTTLPGASEDETKPQCRIGDGLDGLAIAARDPIEREMNDSADHRLAQQRIDGPIAECAFEQSPERFEGGGEDPIELRAHP